MVKSCPSQTLVSSGPLDPNLAWKRSRLRWGSNGLRNTVVVIQVRGPIIRLIFQKRIALLLAFACWLDASFRLDGTVSSAAAVRCSLIQGRVFILRSLGGMFSLPATATLRAFFVAHKCSQSDFSCRLGGLTHIHNPCHQGTFSQGVTRLSRLSRLFHGRHWTFPDVTGLSRSWTK